MRAVLFSLALSAFAASGLPMTALAAGTPAEEEPFVPQAPATTYPNAKPAPSQSITPDHPCECAIAQGACTAQVRVTDEGRRRDNVGADIAYLVEITSTDKRCTTVNYRLRLVSPDGRSEEQAFEAIFDNGAYEAGGQVRANLSPDSKLIPSGVTCFVCSEN
ncbi:hypothetical protein [Zavarzinia sp.]|uniref:hypothetical protein n=1 Tax=Zavarzinia sp. TaxID=2027920 RepID=UPI003564C9AC